MKPGPSRSAEALVALLLPPACREEVLGDLHERYRSPGQYLLEALSTVPVVIASRVRRTSDPRTVLLQSFALYLSFLGAAWMQSPALLRAQDGLLRLALPAALVLAGIVLEDAWARPGRRVGLALARGPLFGIGLALAMLIASPLPREVLYTGCGLAYLLTAGIRMLFPPAENPRQAAIAPKWRGKDSPMQLSKRAVIWLVAAVVAISIVLSIRRGAAPPPVSYSTFLGAVRSGQVAEASVQAKDAGTAEVICRLRDGSRMRAVLPADYRDALSLLEQAHASIEIRQTAGTAQLLLNSAPFLLLLAVWAVLLIRRTGMPGAGLPG